MAISQRRLIDAQVSGLGVIGAPIANASMFGLLGLIFELQNAGNVVSVESSMDGITWFEGVALTGSTANTYTTLSIQGNQLRFRCSTYVAGTITIQVSATVETTGL